MQQSVLSPAVITYNAALTAREGIEQWQQALGFLAVMLQSGLGPNVITYCAAISAGEKCEHWQQALGLLVVI
jgi:hypothetical protein